MDVGGQRNERRKWPKCFNEVDAVLYFESLSSFNQKMEEDNKTNRMKESLKIFNHVCNNKWFKKSLMVLIFTKKDIFNQKLNQYQLKETFPHFSGSNNFEETTKFLQHEFVSQSDNKKKKFLVYFLDSLDSENVKSTINSFVDDIFQNSAKEVSYFDI